MRTVSGKNRAPNAIEKQRRGLLAKVHIAKKQLGLDDGLYRYILREEFGVTSAGALSSAELESLVKRFQGAGWRPKSTGQSQATALRHQAEKRLAEAGIEGKRARKLIAKICGVDDLRFAGDTRTLRRLLAVVGKIERGKG